MPKKGYFSEKCPKSGILAKIGYFSRFGGLLGPLGPPGPLRRGWFYINPSRRGPVPGGKRSPGPRAAQARGNPPEGVQGVSP